MTHAYASPEMVRGERVTVASDIYSLGVLIYRLLSGRHPYAVDGRSHYEINEAIREQEPKRPSTVVAHAQEARGAKDGPGQPTPEAMSQRRGSDPGKLRRRLAGDLDYIVLKALRKEPRERYGSVFQFSEDIRLHLEGLPVSARAGTLRYRGVKFVRRHRWGLAMAVAFLSLILGFTVALGLQFARTLEEHNRATMSRDLFVEILESTDHQTEAEDIHVEDVIQRGVDLFDESFRGELAVQANVLDSLGRIFTSRGQYHRAEPLLEASLRIRRQTLGSDHWLVAESLINQAHLKGSMGEYELAESLSAKGLAILRQRYHQPHRQLAKAINTHASQLYYQGEHDAAELLYREALEMKIELYGEVHLEVATSFSQMGTVRRAKKDHETARRNYQRALDIRKALLPLRHPKLALSYNLIGSLLASRRDCDEAIPYLRQALDIRRQLLDEDHPDVARSRYSLAICLRWSGHYDEAEEHLRRSLEVRCETYGDDNDHCLIVKRNLASLLLAKEEAEAAHELAVEVLVAFQSVKPEGHWFIADAMSVLGACLTALGRYEEAEGLLIESYPVILQANGENAPLTQDARRRICGLYEAWARPEKAIGYCTPPEIG